MKTMILRLGAKAPAEVSWLEPGSGIAARGTLAEAGRACRGAKLLVLVPAAEVLLTRTVIPGRNRSRAIQAAPFALEEFLAEELEKEHFAFGPRQGDGSMAVAVVHKRAMDHWLALLAEYDLRAERLVAETLALPYREGEWSLLVEGDLALLRTGLEAGLAVDLVNLAEIMAAESGLAGAAGGCPLTIYQEEGDQREDIVANAAVAGRKHGDPLAFLAAGCSGEASLDLLQGEYRRHTNWDQLWPRWRRPLFCALALFFLQLLLLGFDYYQLQGQSRELKRRIESVYRATFPDAKQVVNPKAQMEQRLAALAAAATGEGGLLAVLARVGPELQKSEGSVLQRLRYRGKVVELELSLPNQAALAGLRERLAKIESLAVEFRSGSAKDEPIVHVEIKEKSI